MAQDARDQQCACVGEAGPAAKGGLAKGDIILEVDMHEVPTVEAFLKIVSGLKPGSYVSFYVRRDDSTLYRALKIPHPKK